MRFAFESVWRTPIVALVTFAISVSTGLIFRSLGIFPPAGFRTATGNHVLDLLGAVVLSPLGETLILAAIIAVGRFWLSQRNAVLLGALLSAAAHAPAWWGWALASAVPFMIFATPFAVRSRWRETIALSALTHAFHNLYAFLSTLAAS